MPMNFLELASIIFLTPYGRGLLMTVIGLGMVVAGFGQTNQAKDYQQGAVAYSLENPQPIKYNFLKLDGRTDGRYSTFETTEKAYGVFYALYAKNAASNTPAAAIVRAWLPYEKYDCVKQNNCIQAGLVRVSGLGSSDAFDLSATTDNAADVFAKWNKVGLTDQKTVYLIADWQPSTGGDSLLLFGVGGLLIALGVGSFVLGRVAKPKA